MKDNKKVDLNNYKTKYKNKLRKGKLLTFTDQEVEDFDKAHRFYKYNNKEYKLREHLLLDKKKKYKLLEDTYCQIPSKKGICIGASIALVLAIGGVTSYFLINKFKPTTDVIKEDKQIVNAINESIKGSSFTTPHEFVSTIRERKENPILIDELQPVNKDMKYAYNLKNNEVVILNDKDEITYSNTATKDKCDVWKFMDSYSKSTTTIKDTYGTYLKKKSKTNNTLKYTASSNDQETLVFNSNIDVGYNKDIPLKYEKTTEEATVPMVVTNHNDLEIDGALGDISHYGHATSITVSDLSGSYNEYGTVDGDIIVKGDTPVKIAVQETAIVNSIIVANTSNESTITVPDKANVGTIVATTTSGVDISNIVKASDEKKKEVVETEPVNPEELKDFSGGLGTEKSPFTIDLKSQLVNLSTLVAGEGGYESKSYKVTADIDLKDTAFTPIGSRAKPFSGNFDGGNNTISNLSVDNSKKQLDSVGLFGCVYNEYFNTSFKDVEDVWNYDTNLFDETCIDETHYKSKITNITIDNINLINKETKYTGAIIGKCKNVYVSNCKVNSGTINGFKNVGGIVGETSY